MQASPLPEPQPQAAWSAVYAMGLCTFILIASEFMPVSLLSPIAGDLGLTEGQAGQAISISGLFAVLTALSLTWIVGRVDRRFILMGLTSLLALSGTIVALAPTFLILMVGRAVLGIAIGGFWSLSIAMVMRLVPGESIPKALGITNGGSALASIVAAPAASYMGSIIGWRGAFFCVVPLAFAAIAWQAITLPSIPARGNDRLGAMLRLVRSRKIVVGLVAVMLMFAGQFSLFTYLRPFLEQVTHASISSISAMLLAIGVAGFVGTVTIGRLVERGLGPTLWVPPASMALIAAGLALMGESPVATAILVSMWGLVAASATVPWGTWLTRTAPDDAEIGGGILVAVIQLAITAGAILGGVVFDVSGPASAFLTSTIVLVFAAAAGWLSGHVMYRRKAASGAS